MTRKPMTCRLPSSAGVLVLGYLALWCAYTLRAETPPNEPPATIVEGTGPTLAPPRRIKLNTVFRLRDGVQLWDESLRRAVDPIPALSQPMRSDGLTPESFAYIKGFRVEKYDHQGPSRRLLFTIQAEEARNLGTSVELKNVRISYVLTGAAPLSLLLGGKPAPTAASTAYPPRASQPKSAAVESRLFIQSRCGTFDAGEGICHGYGGVEMQIFSGVPGEEPGKPSGLLQTEKLSIRAWQNPAVGSLDVSAYVVESGPGKPPPLVTGTFRAWQEDGSLITRDVQALGMIFEASILDHQEARLDEEGQVLGTSDVRLMRVIFHKQIRMLTAGAASAGVLPFQRETVGAAKAPQPEMTTVECAGPCILDMAALPRKVELGHPEKILPLAQRFEFLNGVSMVTKPLPAKAELGKPAPITGQETELRCRHLCLQYGTAESAAKEPSTTASKMPEYAEALGAVTIRGHKATVPGSSKPLRPFVVDCQRFYYDALTDMVNLEGLPGNPLELSDEIGELRTQLCSINRKTQVISMPLLGPKRLLVRPEALAVLTPAVDPKAPIPEPRLAPAAGALDMGSGELEIRCDGPFTLEVIELVEPNAPTKSKIVLNLEKNVQLQQSPGGTGLQGQRVNLVLDGTTKQPEVIHAEQDVLAEMQGMTMKGAKLHVETAHASSGQPTRQHLHIEGDAARKVDAVLWQGGSALRSPAFAIDGLTGSLWAEQGVVARLKMPAPPVADLSKPAAPAAPAGGVVAGFDLASGGTIALQCDGPFHYDGTQGLLKSSRNVLIKKDTMAILSDSLEIGIDKAPPTQPETKKAEKTHAKPDTKTPLMPKDTPQPKHEKKAPPAAGGMLGGNLKTLECRGRVELFSDDRIVHCDRFFWDLPTDKAVLETSDLADDVCIYLKGPAGDTQLLTARHRLDLDLKNSVLASESRMFVVPYKEPRPRPRKPVPQAGGHAP